MLLFFAFSANILNPLIIKAVSFLFACTPTKKGISKFTSKNRYVQCVHGLRWRVDGVQLYMLQISGSMKTTYGTTRGICEVISLSSPDEFSYVWIAWIKNSIQFKNWIYIYVILITSVPSFFKSTRRTI